MVFDAYDRTEGVGANAGRTDTQPEDNNDADAGATPAQRGGPVLPSGPTSAAVPPPISPPTTSVVAPIVVQRNPEGDGAQRNPRLPRIKVYKPTQTRRKTNKGLHRLPSGHRESRR